MKSRQYRVEGVNPNWQEPAKEAKSGAKSMRKWQAECFKNYAIDKKTGKVVRFLSVQAFCGSGKSILQVEIAVKDVVSSGYTQKQLIAVPQSHIHKGFVGEGECSHISIKQHGKTYKWEIQPEHNFCETTGKKLAALKEWLLATAKELRNGFTKQTISGLNAVCTHAALVAVWKKLTDAEKAKAIRNLTLRIDEAHHIKNVYLEDEGSAEERLRSHTEATELGRLCKFFLDAPAKSNAKLHLTTATMYRGDRRTILSEGVRKQFVEYNLEFIEHFKTTGIETFSLQYEEYRTDPVAQILKRIREEKQEKHYVVVPATGSKWRKNAADARLRRLLAGLRKIYPADRILDLVTSRTQAANKAKLLAEPKSADEGESRFDVVVVCQLGREGTDWCPCSRIHNSSVENSVTLAVQTAGRMFRAFNGKRAVKLHHYVERFPEPRNGTTKRDLLSDRTNALLVCMQFGDMLNPIVLPSTAKPRSGCVKPGERITLASVFGDQYEAVSVKMLEGYDMIKVRTYAAVRELAERVFDDSGVTFDRTSAVDGLIARLARQISPRQSNDIDVAWVREGGFDKIQLVRSVYFGNINSRDLEFVRKAISSRLTVSDHVRTAEELASARGGTLPHSALLAKINPAVHGCKQNHPEAFSHIPQDWRRGKSVDEWVAYAENYVALHGQLPSLGVICKIRGMTGLRDAICAYPEKFSHIPRERSRYSVAERVLNAERLALQNGGMLPCSSWLRNSEYSAILDCIRRHPDAFAHIPREPLKKRTLEEWVRYAEDMAARDGGLHFSGCRTNPEMRSLSAMVHSNPERFAHIPRKKIRLSVLEWVAKARELTKSNEGFLPDEEVLIQMKLFALVKWMKKHPKMFAKFKRKPK